MPSDRLNTTVPEHVLHQFYRGKASNFVALARRTNANYCRTYRSLVAGFDAAAWDRTADQVDPDRRETGAIIHREA